MSRPYTTDDILFSLRNYVSLSEGSLVGRDDVRTSHRPRYEARYCSQIAQKADIDVALASLVVERWASIRGIEVVVTRDTRTLHAVWGHGVVGWDFRTLSEVLRCSVEPVQRWFWLGIEQMVDSLNGARPGTRRSPAEVSLVLHDLARWLAPQSA